MRPDVVKARVLEYSESSAKFLNHEAKESEVFAVVDNSGWYEAITNPQITKEDASPDNLDDVYFQMEVTSLYKDNDIYNKVYYGFLITAGIVLLTLVVFLVALKCLRVKYNKLMAEKAEFKQQLYLKQQSTLKSDISAIRSKSSAGIEQE
jgi:Ni/Fe-hydrogenase subunit HybB-like protein